MNRSATTLVVVLLMIGAAVAVPAVGAAQPTIGAQETPPDETAESNETVAPGAQFSGVVGVQKAEIDGDVESRTFGVRVANANTDNATAKVVAERHQQNERRIDELEQRLSELRQARENGSMSHGEYAARTARIHTEIKNVRRSSNETARVAADLPNETLEANGVDPRAIATVRNRASELSGPEVAAVARSIAGSSVDRAPPERTGAPERGNRTAGGDRGPDDRGADDRGSDDRGADDGDTESGATTTDPEGSESPDTESADDGSTMGSGPDDDSTEAGNATTESGPGGSPNQAGSAD